MKISRRLSFWTLSALFLLGAAGLFVHYLLMVRVAEQELDTLAKTAAPVIEESLSHSMISRDARVLNKTLLSLEGIESIDRITVVDPEGFIKAGTGAWTANSRLFSTGGERRSVEAGRWVHDGSEGIYRWAQAVRNRPACYGCHDPKAKNNGFIIVDFSRRVMEARLEEHIARESLLFAVVFGLAGVIVFRLSNTMVIKRLDGVVKAMQNFEPGGPVPLAPVSGNDEITQLGDGFNEMAVSISASQAELKQYAGELLALTVSSNVVTAVPLTENLYEAVCNVVIRELKLRMAWIGLLKEGSLDVEPVAQCGFAEGYLSSERVTGDECAGMGPTGMAIKTKMPQIMNDIATDPRYRVWKDEALKRGYASSMVLPLLSSEGDILGVLNLYSNEPRYFAAKRVGIFMIFSNQVATAIENRSLIENLEKKRTALARQFDLISISQKEWQMTFDSITDLVTIHGEHFNIIKANKAAADFFDINEQDIVNKKCYDVFHGGICPPGNCPHVASMRGKGAVTEEVRDPRTGKLFRVSTFPYYSGEGGYIGSIHVARDITEEKETEMRLIMSERLAALGQMASGLAHEINTPLASIAGCAEGLLMKVRSNRYDPQLFAEYLQIVEEEIQRCKSITTGMLSFVRTSTYEQKNVRINEVLDKALEIIGFQGRLRDVTINRRYEDLPVIHGSEGELRQVFLAILINALDAMEDAGTLTLETGTKAASVFMKITDTGPGISSGHINRIFDPFFTTKSEKGGTGLGLSVAYKIITNHHGTIDVSSEEEKGTIFTLTFTLPDLQ